MIRSTCTSGGQFDTMSVENPSYLIGKLTFPVSTQPPSLPGKIRQIPVHVLNTSDQLLWEVRSQIQQQLTSSSGLREIGDVTLNRNDLDSPTKRQAPRNERWTEQVPHNTLGQKREVAQGPTTITNVLQALLTGSVVPISRDLSRVCLTSMST